MHSARAFLDLLFNCLLGFVFLFIVAFLMVDIDKRKADIKTKAEFVITVTWDFNNPDDVDSWLCDPTGNIIFFRAKENGLMHLDRDDLGYDNDKLLMPDGTEIFYPYNQEITTIRGHIPGRWIFNIHLYKRSSSSQDPTNVEVKMEKLNPKVETVFLKHLALSKQGEEVTVARFEMNASGQILSMDEIQTELVSERLTRASHFP